MAPTGIPEAFNETIDPGSISLARTEKFIGVPG